MITNPPVPQVTFITAAVIALYYQMPSAHCIRYFKSLGNRFSMVLSANSVSNSCLEFLHFCMKIKKLHLHREHPVNQPTGYKPPGYHAYLLLPQLAAKAFNSSTSHSKSSELR
jgi:hypothetical protein